MRYKEPYSNDSLPESQPDTKTIDGVQYIRIDGNVWAPCEEAYDEPQAAYDELDDTLQPTSQFEQVVKKEKKRKRRGAKLAFAAFTIGGLQVGGVVAGHMAADMGTVTIGENFVGDKNVTLGMYVEDIFKTIDDLKGDQ